MRTLHTVFHSDCSQQCTKQCTTFQPTVHKSYLSSMYLPKLTSYLSDHRPFWQVWSDISLYFWLVPPWWLVMFHTFSCSCWPSIYLLWKNVYLDLLSLFNWFIIIFSCWELWVLWILTSCQMFYFQVLSFIQVIAF